MFNTGKQRGVALITALLVVSLATILAVSLVEHLYYDIRRSENILRLDQAQLYNANAVEFGRVLLKLDRDANNDYDSLEDINLFNDQAAMFPVDGGSVSAKIVDLQSCFNLNNLSKTNTELARHRDVYGKLLDQLGIDNANRNTLIDSLIDWLDEDDITEAQGAEFDYYIGLDKPYRTANTLMVSPSELMLVKGYTEEVIEIIEQHICVLPVVNTGININTASVEMLESIEGLEGHGSTIIKDRDGEAENTDDDAPYASPKDFETYVKDTLKVKKFDSKGIQVFSEYFMMQSNTQLGAGDVKLFSVIYRNQSDGNTELIRQTRGAL